MNIPEAAIEAAAGALNKAVPNSDGVLWEFDEVVDREIGGVQRRALTLTDAARDAITAALPAIREAIAQEIEADDTDLWTRRHAARIVRGTL